MLKLSKYIGAVKIYLNQTNGDKDIIQIEAASGDIRESCIATDTRHMAHTCQ